MALPPYDSAESDTRSASYGVCLNITLIPFFRVHSVVPSTSFTFSFFTGEPFSSTSSPMRGSLTTLSSKGSTSASTAAFSAPTISSSEGTASPSFSGWRTSTTRFSNGLYRFCTVWLMVLRSIISISCLSSSYSVSASGIGSPRRKLSMQACANDECLRSSRLLY